VAKTDRKNPLIDGNCRHIARPPTEGDDKRYGVAGGRRHRDHHVELPQTYEAGRKTAEADGSGNTANRHFRAGHGGVKRTAVCRSRRACRRRDWLLRRRIGQLTALAVCIDDDKAAAPFRPGVRQLARVTVNRKVLIECRCLSLSV